MSYKSPEFIFSREPQKNLGCWLLLLYLTGSFSFPGYFSMPLASHHSSIKVGELIHFDIKKISLKKSIKFVKI